MLQSATGLAELYIPPVPKETYDQATNTDGPMLKDNELEGGGAPLSPGGKGGLSPAPPSSGVRTTPARADHGNGPLQSPGAFEGEDGELSSQNGGTAADGAAVRVARLSGEAAAAVLEDASFRTFVEKKSLVVSIRRRKRRSMYVHIPCSMHDMFFMITQCTHLPLFQRHLFRWSALWEKHFFSTPPTTASSTQRYRLPKPSPSMPLPPQRAMKPATSLPVQPSLQQTLWVQLALWRALGLGQEVEPHLLRTVAVLTVRSFAKSLA